MSFFLRQFASVVRRQLLRSVVIRGNSSSISLSFHLQPPRRTATTNSSTPPHLPHNHPYSRFSANLIMTGSDTLRLTDYDFIGFDLDNTLVRYKITAMCQLQYDALARNLVDRHDYPGDRLLRPLCADRDFLQRGLICDLRRGNVLKVSPDGYIRRAAHGTRFLCDEEITLVYGACRRWQPLVDYTADLLSTWNGPAADEMRTLLDYFDLPISVLFARCVDTLDGGKPVHLETWSYDIMPGILDGLFRLYSREHFKNADSPFFEALKAQPDKYIHCTAPKVIEFVRQLREQKTTFLLTGSHIDFATFTATHALGADWRQLFDVVVSFAKKPGFFGQRRPFFRLTEEGEETTEVAAKHMLLGEAYSQGNYAELMEVLLKKNGGPFVGRQPKVLYIGDNMVQDVYAPCALSGCDTVAVVEELRAESAECDGTKDENDKLLRSPKWGSYFGTASDPTLWSDVIQRNARICVADVADLAAQPLDHEFGTFTPDQPSCSRGFWPAEPRHFGGGAE